jgi:hypothetical protein
MESIPFYQETYTMWFTSQLRRSKTKRRAVHKPTFVPRLESLEDRTMPSTLMVTNTLDKGAGSLRATITRAKDGDTIIFDPSLNGQTITLTSDQLTISKSLDIEGPGAGLLAISGNDKNRVFSINEGLTVTIAGLTLTHGRAGNSLGSDSAGGGILNVNSTLTLANDVLSYNEAIGTTTAGGAVANRNGGILNVTGTTFLKNQVIASLYGEGGAIANTLDGSALVANNCTFLGNEAIGTNGGSTGGGAIEDDGDVKGASATFNGCIFTGNMAIGSDGGVISTRDTQVGSGNGGAITSSGPGATLTVTNSSFTANQAIAGNGGNGGSGAGTYILDTAAGGAIICFNQVNVIIDQCKFSGNQVFGGSNAVNGTSGAGQLGLAFGGAVFNLSTATITCSTFDNNLAQGGNGNTDLNGDSLVGAGTGGAITDAPFFDATGGVLNASGCTFTNNKAIGGTGNTGGPLSSDGIGGAVVNLVGLGAALANHVGAVATFTSTTFAGNLAIGGQGTQGGNGADGLGGALANILGSTFTVSGCTLSGNQALGGAGASGVNGGNGFGGGLYNDGISSLTVTSCTLTKNSATGGAAGSGGSAGQEAGGGIYIASGATAKLDSYTVAHTTTNTALTDPDIDGTYVLI